MSAVDVRTVDDQQTHNLTVEGLQTYYVGAGDNTTLVHNQNDPCGADQWTSGRNLDDHYNDHGEEMGYDSQVEYRAAAEDLMCECDGGRPGVEVKVEGSTRYYLDPESGEFGIRSDNGVVTFFEPDNPQDYFNKQKGTVVNGGS